VHALRSGNSTTTGAAHTAASVAKTPADRIATAGHDIPLHEVVADAYDERRERLRYRDWKIDQAMAALFHPLPERQKSHWLNLDLPGRRVVSTTAHPLERCL